MNFPAPVAVLGFLAGMGGLALSMIAALACFSLGRAKWARRIGALVGVGAIVYFALLFGLSLASREVTLPPGQEKYFCEIDCHLAYSVIGSREELQNGQPQLRVTVRTRFDENTISPQRPRDALLAPNPRKIVLVDQLGRALDPIATNLTPFTRSLIPGQSYKTELVFQLTANGGQPRLLITSAGWEERFLIGGENSFGHKKTFFSTAGTGTSEP